MFLEFDLTISHEIGINHLEHFLNSEGHLLHENIKFNVYYIIHIF